MNSNESFLVFVGVIAVSISIGVMLGPARGFLAGGIIVLCIAYSSWLARKFQTHDSEED